MTMTIYLDYAATTPMDKAVLEAMLPYLGDAFGNPASLHAFGQEALAAVEDARAKIASFLGAEPEEIVFTSGGTESDNLALKGVSFASRGRGDHLVTSTIEHPAVLESCRFLERQGFRVTYLPVDGLGMVDPEAVSRALTGRTILVSIMHANNEIGTMEPVEEIGMICRERGIPFHTDAVQTFGHVPVDVRAMNCDLLSASGHKLYGPKGVGILYVRRGTRMEPLLSGGEQERGLRASTLNVPGIAGLAKAVELAQKEMKDEMGRLCGLREKLIAGLKERIDGLRLNGHPTLRLPNNVHFSVAGVEGEGLLLSLDVLGIACSTGSACSSRSAAPSHVLAAVGLPRELIRGSLRLSLGRWTTEAEIEAVLETVPAVVRRLQALSGAAGDGR